MAAAPRASLAWISRCSQRLRTRSRGKPSFPPLTRIGITPITLTASTRLAVTCPLSPLTTCQGVALTTSITTTTITLTGTPSAPGPTRPTPRPRPRQLSPTILCRLLQTTLLWPLLLIRPVSGRLTPQPTSFRLSGSCLCSTRRLLSLPWSPNLRLLSRPALLLPAGRELACLFLTS